MAEKLDRFRRMAGGPNPNRRMTVLEKAVEQILEDDETTTSSIETNTTNIATNSTAITALQSATGKSYYFTGGSGWNLTNTFTDKTFSTHILKSSDMTYSAGKVYCATTGLYEWQYEFNVLNTTGSNIIITIQLDNNGSLETNTLREYYFPIGETKVIKGSVLASVTTAGDYLSLKGKISTGTLSLGTVNQHFINKVN